MGHESSKWWDDHALVVCEECCRQSAVRKCMQEQVCICERTAEIQNGGAKNKVLSRSTATWVTLSKWQSEGVKAKLKTNAFTRPSHPRCENSEADRSSRKRTGRLNLNVVEDEVSLLKEIQLDQTSKFVRKLPLLDCRTLHLFKYHHLPASLPQPCEPLLFFPCSWLPFFCRCAFIPFCPDFTSLSCISKTLLDERAYKARREGRDSGSGLRKFRC